MKCLDGTPGGTRTHNILLRRQMLYPVELPGRQRLRQRLRVVVKSPQVKCSGQSEPKAVIYSSKKSARAYSVVEKGWRSSGCSPSPMNLTGKSSSC